jgi:prepilin-type N-terminal cleavage/methylation domain-containing protein
MQLAAQLHHRRGFSLVELLMAVAVISMLAAIGIFTMGSINDDARQTMARRNAQSFAQMVASARAVGVEFHSSTKEGILAELVKGVRGQLNMQPETRTALLHFCSLDAGGNIIVRQV